MNGTLLGRLMPVADQQELHTIRLPVPPDQVWAALHAITYRDLPLMRLLMGVRALPARLSRGGSGPPLDEPLLALFRRMGFVTVVEQPGAALAMGTVAQFWRLSPAPARTLRDGADLLSFNSPGYAKAVMSFEIAPDGDGSRLLTETRVQATDAAAQRLFRRYWLVIRPGSGLIRRSILCAVRRRCGRLHRDAQPDADARAGRLARAGLALVWRRSRHRAGGSSVLAPTSRRGRRR